MRANATAQGGQTEGYNDVLTIGRTLRIHQSRHGGDMQYILRDGTPGRKYVGAAVRHSGRGSSKSPHRGSVPRRSGDSHDTEGRGARCSRCISAECQSLDGN